VWCCYPCYFYLCCFFALWISAWCFYPCYFCVVLFCSMNIGVVLLSLLFLFVLFCFALWMSVWCYHCYFYVPHYYVCSHAVALVECMSLYSQINVF
jgi:hypothetical protein